MIVLRFCGEFLPLPALKSAEKLFLSVKRAGKESTLPTHHFLLFNVNKSPTAPVGMHSNLVFHCFNRSSLSLVFHLVQQLSIQQLGFISFPFSLLSLRPDSSPQDPCHLSSLPWWICCDGGCRSEPQKAPRPICVEIEIVTCLITQSNLFLLQLCTAFSLVIIAFFTVSLLSLSCSIIPQSQANY